MPLSSVTSSQCNFNILCGDATGTDRFGTGFYGLTDMPTAFQKAMDCTLQELEGVFCYLDDILIVTKGNIQELNELVEKVMQRLDAECWALKLSKCEFSVNQLTWLGYEINEDGYSPKFSKIDAIQSLNPPRNLKQLRSFTGTLNHSQRFIPDLNTHTVYFWQSLKACNKQSVLCGEEQDSAFKSIINLVAYIFSLFHYDSSKNSRVKCDASHNGLGACLEQEIEPGVSAPTAFASRFLNNAEKKYNTNELQLLAIVWACEHFRTYLLGNRSQVLTDHKAIISALSENYNNKSYQSPLSRWADCLLPFDFEVIHVPGVTLGIVDYLSRYPTFSAPAPSNYDDLFVVKSIEAFNSALKFINSFDLQNLSDWFCPPSQECIDLSTQRFSWSSSEISPAGADLKLSRSVNQSDHVMQIFVSSFSPREGVELCSESKNQSKTGMLIKKRRPVSLAIDHCLRPELLENSQLSFLSSSQFLRTHNQSIDLPDKILLPDTSERLTTHDPDSTLFRPLDSQTILNSTAEQNDLLTFVENFSLNSPNFRRPSPRPPMRSRQLGGISRLDQIRQHNRTRVRAARTRFVAARTVSRKEGHNQLLEALRRCRLSKRGKIHTAAKVEVFAVNSGKPIISKSKKEIVGLPGLFDADLLSELTEEDRFLGPMERAITNKVITSFNKFGAYMAHFWHNAAVVSNCVIIDNKLAIPEALRQAVLARLHRSQPGQEALMSASEYIW